MFVVGPREREGEQLLMSVTSIVTSSECAHTRTLTHTCPEPTRQPDRDNIYAYSYTEVSCLLALVTCTNIDRVWMGVVQDVEQWGLKYRKSQWCLVWFSVYMNNFSHMDFLWQQKKRSEHCSWLPPPLLKRLFEVLIQWVRFCSHKSKIAPWWPLTPTPSPSARALLSHTRTWPPYCLH